MGRPNLYREGRFPGANGNSRDKFIFFVRLTTSKICNHTWLIRTLLKSLTIHTHKMLGIELNKRTQIAVANCLWLSGLMHIEEWLNEEEPRNQ